MASRTLADCSPDKPCACCLRVATWLDWLTKHAASLALDDMEDRQHLADLLALAVHAVPSDTVLPEPEDNPA